MTNQRGIIAPFYLYALAALAVIAALAGLYWRIDSNGYDRGKAETEAKQLAANQQAKEAADADRKKREAEAARSAADLASASNQARDFEARWRAERKRGSVLATVSCPASSIATTGGVGVISDSAGSGGGITLRLSAEFLRGYDAAWTDEAGKPVFADTGNLADAAAPPVTLDTLLDLHGENAARSSANFRQCSALIALVRRLRAQ